MEKTKKYILAILVNGYGFFRGKAKRVPNAPEKFLVVQMAKLGDMICTTPVIQAIKKNFPHADVFVLGNKINKEVLANNPDVKGYIVFSGILRTSTLLKSGAFDIAILAGGPDIGSLSATFFAGIPCIVAPTIEGGYCPLYDAPYKLAIKNVITRPHCMEHYAPREYLKLLEPLNIFETDTKKYVYASNEAERKVEVFWKDHNLVGKTVIGIAPGAGNKIKQWPPQKFAAVAQHLVKATNTIVLVIGGKRDTEEVTEMMGNIQPKESVISTVDRFSIDELKAVIKKLSLFVAADTGAIYIAEAYEVPTVDIIGPVDERVQPPQGKKHLLIVPSRKKAELYIMNSKVYDVIEAKRQAQASSVEEVVKACDQLLNSFGETDK